MENPAPTLDPVIAAALTVAARDGWRRTTLAAVAEEAGVSLAELHARVPDRWALPAACFAAVDRSVLAEAAVGPLAESPRETLFELMMLRFELLADHREGLRAMLSGLGLDPAALAGGAFGAVTAMGWMLEAAGLDAHGLRGLLRRKALMGVEAWTLRAFLADETADLSHTMKALDQALGRLESWVFPAPENDNPEGIDAAQHNPHS